MGSELLKCCSSAKTSLLVRLEIYLALSLGRANGLTQLALDVWSAGTIMLCILSCKFPIFTASDDVEALMELAAVFGRTTMEKCAKLHGADLFSPSY